MKIKRKLINIERRVTAPLRVLPDFLIIGAQKAGTSSLFADLVRHPCVWRSSEKEVHYFDWPENFKRGIWWYRSHFPLMIRKYYSTNIRRAPFVTGEASPDYLFYPHAPERVAQILPNVKIIVLLRDPVDRAFSHYHMEVNSGNESLPFEEAIRTRERELEMEIWKMAHDKNYCGYIYQRFSYLLRGIYWQQLQQWFRFFPREQFLILNSESYFQNPDQECQKVIRFLGLPEHELKKFNKYNQGKYTTNLSKETRDYLNEYYKPHNERLYECLKMNFLW